MEQVSVKPGEWTQQKVAALFELFPSVVTEVEDEQGTIRQVIDFAQLRQELSGFIAEEKQERYELTWPGRRRAEQLACSETDKRLVPVRQQSEDWETTENIYIEGDNLDALKLLYKSYANKIRCIYIDPPYNTGNEFIYNDRFRRRGGVPEREGQADHTQGEPAYNCIHSEWLSMMYPRLKLARELLSEDGAIFISIDDHEVANLRKLCDHLFGEDRFGGQIIVQTNKGGQDYKPLAKTHEYLLCYFKSGSGRLRPLPKTDLSTYRYEDGEGRYELRELRNRNPKFNRSNRPNLYYPIYVDPNNRDAYGYCAISLVPDERHTIEVYPLNSRGQDSCWRWGRERLAESIVPGSPEQSGVVARQKRGGGWNIYEKNRKRTTKAKTIWDETEMRTENGTAAFRQLFGELYFDHPKPVELVEKVVRLATDPDSIVLDFFSGSATTAHAVMKLNAEDGGRRKTILVQLPEKIRPGTPAYEAGFKTICDIGKERIRRAARLIREQTGASIDGGFRLFRIEADETHVEQSGDGIDPMDRFIEILVDSGVEWSARIEQRRVGDNTVFVAGDGQLAACLDKRVTEDTVLFMARMSPGQAVFYRQSFTAKERQNAAEHFRNLSPETDLKWR